MNMKRTLLGNDQDGNQIYAMFDADKAAANDQMRKVRICIIDKTTQEPREEVDVYTSADSVLFADGLNLIEELDGLLTYTNLKPVTANIGGIQKGKVFNKANWKDVFNELLYPYVAPTIASFGQSKNPNSYYETGTNISPITFSTTINVGSDDIKSVILEQDGNPVYTFKTLTPNGGSESINFTNDIKTETKFRIIVQDAKDKKYYSSYANYRFRDPVFVGVIDTGVEITETLVKSLSKYVTTGQIVHTMNPKSQRMIIVYPKTYVPKSIIDKNGFEIIKSFNTQGNVSIVKANGVVEQYTYIVTDPTDQSNFKITIKP